MIILSLLLSKVIWAAPEPKVNFKTQVHVTAKEYFADQATKSQPLKCGGHYIESGTPTKLVALVAPGGQEFDLHCKSGETSMDIDLVVFQGAREVAKFPKIASGGGDCDVNYSTEAWLVDLNNDQKMDLVRRSKYKKVDGACGGSGSNKILQQSDDLKVFFWLNDKFVPMNFVEETTKKYLKQFDFKF